VLCQLTNWFAALEEDASSIGPSLGPLVGGVRRIASHFTAYRQEDAHDFVTCLLDACHMRSLDDLGGEAAFDGATALTSGVYHLFGGVTRGAVRCCACGAVSHSYESFLHLSLEVTGRISSLEDALAANYCATEQLTGRDAYQCDACKKKVTARKSARIAVAPNVLVIALKRYTVGFFSKINKRVTFPAELDIAKFMAAPQKRQQHPLAADGEKENGENGHMDGSTHASDAPAGDGDVSQPYCTKYALIGVLVHLDWALSTAAGHYVCYVRRGTQWYKCDDATVTAVTETQVLSQTAYMLFYQSGPQPAPHVRPPWVQDTPEEAAAEAKRMAEAALRARAAARGHDEEDEDAGSSSDLTVIPEYKLRRHDSQDAPSTRLDGSPETMTEWPLQLSLHIHLPGVRSAADIEVRVEGQSFSLLASSGRGQYVMESTLPFPVDDHFKGEFDASESTLVLNLAVVAKPRTLPGTGAPPAPPPVPPPPPTRLTHGRTMNGLPRRGVGAVDDLRNTLNARRIDTSSDSDDD
jgi:ubiquitin carboxyl-terminal hydrolase 36/42